MQSHCKRSVPRARGPAASINLLVSLAPSRWLGKRARFPFLLPFCPLWAKLSSAGHHALEPSLSSFPHLQASFLFFSSANLFSIFEKSQRFRPRSSSRICQFKLRLTANKAKRESFPNASPVKNAFPANTKLAFARSTIHSAKQEARLVSES